MKVKNLRWALIQARIAALPFSADEDEGTCNFDTPVLRLPKWSKEEIEAAFKDTGLRPDIDGNLVYIYGGTSGQASRRTEMAEAIRDSLKDSGYDAMMYYKMD